METKNIPASTGEALDLALARSVIYGVLSAGLHAPMPELVQALRSDVTRASLLEAACYLQNHHGAMSAGSESAARARCGDECGTGAQLVARTERITTCLPGIDLEALRLRYACLFGHTLRGSICPYEAEYGQDALFQQSHQLADLTGFYAAFGLEASESDRERLDHVSCELEFLEFLCRKEAWALEARDASLVETTRAGARLFLQNHLARFGRAFARELLEHDPDGFHGRLGHLLLEFLGFECARLGIAPGPALLHLRAPLEDDVPMQCATRCDPAACGVEGGGSG